MIRKRAQRSYDHRLVRLVQKTGDITIATKLGVPRSTAAGWVRRAHKPVTTVPELDSSPVQLRARVLRLERRLRPSRRHPRPIAPAEARRVLRQRAQLPASPLGLPRPDARRDVLWEGGMRFRSSST